MNDTNRYGENGVTPLRSQRIFKQQSYWYYSTREGINIGPFDSELEAARGVTEYVEFISRAPIDMVDTLKRYSNGAA